MASPLIPTVSNHSKPPHPVFRCYAWVPSILMLALAIWNPEGKSRPFWTSWLSSIGQDFRGLTASYTSNSCSIISQGALATVFYQPLVMRRLLVVEFHIFIPTSRITFFQNFSLWHTRPHFKTARTSSLTANRVRSNRHRSDKRGNCFYNFIMIHRNTRHICKFRPQ